MQREPLLDPWQHTRKMAQDDMRAIASSIVADAAGRTCGDCSHASFYRDAVSGLCTRTMGVFGTYLVPITLRRRSAVACREWAAQRLT